MTLPDYLHFWGKAHPNEGQKNKWHPLAYHSLDVAATAQRLLEIRAHDTRLMANRLGLEEDQLINFSVFLVALHDIGKFSRSFQALAPDHWPREVLGDCPDECYPAAHWQISFELLSGLLFPCLKKALTVNRHALFPLLRAVAGHHGSPPKDEVTINQNLLGKKCEEMASHFTSDLSALLKPPKMQNLKSPAAKKLSYWLAGLAVAADWLGSNQEYFCYERPEYSLADYWQTRALPRASKAVEQSGLLSPPPVSQACYASLFQIKTPHPMQQAVSELELPEGPVLAIIEDATGSGKTEAATLLALRMMQRGKAGGLYFALPTMATANAMFARMGKDYRNLFTSQSKPSLALAHGQRTLDEKWYASIKLPAQMRASLKGPDEETAAQCAKWIADDRRKTFFAHVGAGTIDQALLAVLPSKFQSLRLWGLADRVLIIDEAHAYDAYMSKELETLLTFHAANGGSAIVLSATLPNEKRNSLVKAFTSGLDCQTTDKISENPNYPLLTISSAEGVRESANIKPAPHTVRKVEAERLDGFDQAIDRITEAARKGAAVAFIRNAVDDAIEAVRFLHGRDIEADLFHARFAMSDRQRIETEAVERFGRSGTEKDRKGRVLVATQVIEQSLDLDFDLMVSDLAPIDLLIQRAGRLWRHMDMRPKDNRPVAGPKLLVISPDPQKVQDENWLKDMGHKGSYVYPNHALLWRSAKTLFDKGGFKAPDDLRAMIEYAYQIEGECPESLKKMDREAEGVLWGDRTNASFNLLELKDGYTKSGSWLEEDCVRTRLGEPTITLRLARITGDKLLPWCQDENPTRAWALSEIRLRTDWLTGVDISRNWQTTIDRIRKDWPKWQRNTLIAPVDDQGQLLLENLPQPLRYGDFGLERESKAG